MKWYVPVVLGAVLFAGLANAEELAAPAAAAAGPEVKAASEAKVPASGELKTDEQKFSYVMGLSLGKYFKDLEEKFDLNMIQKGILDGYSDTKPLLDEEQTRKIQEDFAKRQHNKQIQKIVVQVQKNRKAADEFLAANKTKEGVKTLESGLQYKVIKEGKGIKPTAEDTVKVHYKGRTIEGKEFDSSYKRNEPAEFQVKQVIPGWQEAMQQMPVGSVYEIYLPPDLAYGDQGAPPVIEPGSLIIFEVELLDVVKAKKADDKSAPKDKADTEESKQEKAEPAATEDKAEEKKEG